MSGFSQLYFLESERQPTTTFLLYLHTPPFDSAQGDLVPIYNWVATHFWIPNQEAVSQYIMLVHKPALRLQ